MDWGLSPGQPRVLQGHVARQEDVRRGRAAFTSKESFLNGQRKARRRNEALHSSCGSSSFFLFLFLPIFSLPLNNVIGRSTAKRGLIYTLSVGVVSKQCERKEL